MLMELRFYQILHSNRSRLFIQTQRIKNYLNVDIKKREYPPRWDLNIYRPVPVNVKDLVFTLTYLHTCFIIF